MEHENFTIEIEGEEVSDLYQDLSSLEVELDEEMASFFRMQIAIMQQTDGTWTYLDDERFMVWKQVTVTAGFESGADEIISGYITHVKPVFAPDPSQCTLEVWGMDGSVLMDREEKLKDWPNKKDSDIASEIFNAYGFSPQVEDTEVIHDEAISTIIQRETDMQFLRRLALRNGFECYVEGSTGFFSSPQVDADPQPVLAVLFGGETNVNSFSIDLNALTPVNVAMFQVDRANKETLDASAESSQQTALGDTDASGLLAAGMNPGQVYIGMNNATGNAEMSALCQGLYHKGEWFVTAEGEIAGNYYEHVLRPRGTVTIKGAGETHSGVYYVAHVTHCFTSEGYTQSFKVKRNAIMPTGSEEFSASSGLF
ncbi:MAG: contractile injection system protein, VgrG/Pvc8 family [Deltaproteobacteria bacterium]|nr:contractile injection system protein, VgrG/Pvc8 family [Deltaproteobacteria bacterium]